MDSSSSTINSTTYRIPNHFNSVKGIVRDFKCCKPATTKSDYLFKFGSRWIGVVDCWRTDRQCKIGTPWQTKIFTLLVKVGCTSLGRVTCDGKTSSAKVQPRNQTFLHSHQGQKSHFPLGPRSPNVFLSFVFQGEDAIRSTVRPK